MKTFIEISIDEFVAEGFSRSEALSIRDSVNKNLRRLFNNNFKKQSPPQNKTVQNVDVGTVRIAASNNYQKIGQSIARSVYQQSTSPQNSQE